MLRATSFAILTIAVIFTSLTPLAHADMVVFDNGVGGAVGISSSFPSNTAGFFAADDASLATTTTINGIEWTGAYADNTPNSTSFNISILADNGGSPGAVLATINAGTANEIDSGIDLSSGLDVYEYSAGIDFVAVANTTYWFSIAGDTVDNFGWGHVPTPTSSNTVFNARTTSQANQALGFWFASGNRQDFRLTAAVPEPSSLLVMLGTGMAGLARRRRIPVGT